MSTVIQINSNRVDPILLRPVLGVVLTVALLKIERLMSWLQSGRLVVSIFPLVAVTVFIKQLRNVHQTLNLWRACCSVAQLCPTLCDPLGCSPPGSSVCGIF